MVDSKDLDRTEAVGVVLLILVGVIGRIVVSQVLSLLSWAWRHVYIGIN